MLPPFDESGNLPPGVHSATWAEVAERFGGNAWREALLLGLRQALASLADAGCRVAYLDGSFVTTKEYPGDYDLCYDVVGVAVARLDPVFFRFENQRVAQKAKYGGELFPAVSLADETQTFLEFFQVDKETGGPKGIVAISPRSAR